MKMTPAILVRSALTCAVAGAVILLAANRNFYESTIVSLYLSWALFSGLVVLLLVRRSWQDALFAGLAAGVLAAIDFLMLRFPAAYFSFQLHANTPGGNSRAWPSPVPYLSFLGLSGLAILCSRVIWTKAKEERKLLLCALIPCALFATSDWGATTLLDFTTRLHPRTFDLYLYSFDCSLRIQPSFEVGRWFAHWPVLYLASYLFYVALAVILGVVFGARLRLEGARALQAGVAFLIIGPLGIILYNMLPATGPVHIFHQNFPLHPPAIADVARLVLGTVPVSGARNAIPSLHMAWVLLAWWYSRGLAKWVRGLALLFVIFTVLATLGTGEHYLIDLVVAFPFALMVQGIAAYQTSLSSPQRKLPIMAGLLMTLLWFALLSYRVSVFWISPILPWAAIIATVAGCVWLRWRLQRANEPEAAGVEAAALVAAG